MKVRILVRLKPGVLDPQGRAVHHSLDSLGFEGVEDALGISPDVDVRLFGKPVTRPYRRMGVALAVGDNTDNARALAFDAARKVRIVYRD